MIYVDRMGMLKKEILLMQTTKPGRMKIMRLGISVYNFNMLMKIPQIVFQTCNLEFQTQDNNILN